MAILTDLKDPRVRDVTVTQVEVTPDMRQAKVHVSIMGDETKQNLVLRGLQCAAGYLQSKISDRIETRYTPRLEFTLDMGVKRSIEIAQILHQVLPPGEAEASELEIEDAEADSSDPDAEDGDEPPEEPEAGSR